jgi:hypothetical protein
VFREAQLPGVGFDVARDDAKHRGFTRTVWSDHPNRGPFFQLEGNPIGNDDLSEALGYTFQL